MHVPVRPVVCALMSGFVRVRRQGKIAGREAENTIFQVLIGNALLEMLIAHE